MSMPDIARSWTREDLLLLPEDGNRYELLDGQLLVTPSPAWSHQYAVVGLLTRIEPYVRRHRLGGTCVAPADLDFKSGQLLQPDLFVVALFEGRQPLHWSEAGIPLLIVEVVSPSSALSDRNRKRRKYQTAGVGEYWIVDPDARLIERWTPEDQRPEILTDRIEWQPDAALPALAIELPDYFREVWGETEKRKG